MYGKLSAIIVVAALSAAGAAAADNFTGAYVGGDPGMNNSSIGGSYTTSPAMAPAYGVQGGYGWDVGGNVLLGVDGHLDAFEDTLHAPAGQYGGHAYGLGLKVGVPLDTLMPYARLGYDRTQGTGVLSGFNSASANGGVGLMYKFAPSWSLEGEWSAATPSVGGLKLKSNTLNFGVNYHFDFSSSSPSRR